MPATARDVLTAILAEAADRGEVRPVRRATALGQPVPCVVPERLSVSMDNLRALAVLSGFSGLEEAFLAVEPH